MKIVCSIPPRRDGTVIAEVEGRSYRFLPNDSGCLVCEVDDSDADTILSWPGFSELSDVAPEEDGGTTSGRRSGSHPEQASE